LEVNKQRRASAHEELLELEVQKHKWGSQKSKSSTPEKK
jgi:hypothetical protein